MIVVVNRVVFLWWFGLQGVCDDEMSLKNLGSSATAVTKALDDLMLHIKRGANRGRQVAIALYHCHHHHHHHHRKNF